MDMNNKRIYVQSKVNYGTARRIADLSVRLLQNISDNGQNILVSPVSLVAALILAQIGAREETLSELERLTGRSTGDIVELLNVAFQSPDNIHHQPSDNIHNKFWFNILSKQDKTNPISFANSIWLRETGVVSFNADYKEHCEQIVGTECRSTIFDDTTCSKINEWVRTATDGQIENIVNVIDDDNVCIILNALSFKEAWAKPYESSNTKKNAFYTVNGCVKNIDFIAGEENLFLIDDNARGFIKKYKTSRYEFIALLPDKGISLDEYIAKLDGRKLLSIIEEPIEHPVEVSFPKFSIESSLDMKDVLKKMGVSLAFDELNADFSGIATVSDPNYNIYLSNIKQKTKIEVDESGTKATAVTYMDMLCYCSCITPKPYRLCLDRPFLYMIYDREANVPLFMGTINNL